MDLVWLWFGLVVLCWVLFLVLEGFDFGVGMLTPLLGRDDAERGAIVRTVGPFWDGNEVWLVAAIGVTFAAFPEWYAALLAGLYLPMVVLLLLLAGRGVAIEFRGKFATETARHRADLALAGCSAGIVAVMGAILSVFVHGLALDANGNVAAGSLGRTLDPVLGVWGLTGAAIALAGALLLGSTFLGLRTTGPVRESARLFTVLLGLGCAAVAAVVTVTMLLTHDAWGVPLLVLLVVALVTAAAWSGHEASAFAVISLATAGAVVAVLTANVSADVVLPSTLDPAWSLTLSNAAATHSTLRLITFAGILILPGVLAYQAFSYWIFRARVTTKRAPQPTQPPRDHAQMHGPSAPIR